VFNTLPYLSKLAICVCHQAIRENSVSSIECSNKCATSTDLFSNYGQFAISNSVVGHILYSAKTTQSTIILYSLK